MFAYICLHFFSFSGPFPTPRPFGAIRWKLESQQDVEPARSRSPKAKQLSVGTIGFCGRDVYICVYNVSAPWSSRRSRIGSCFERSAFLHTPGVSEYYFFDVPLCLLPAALLIGTSSSYGTWLSSLFTWNLWGTLVGQQEFQLRKALVWADDYSPTHHRSQKLECLLMKGSRIYSPTRFSLGRMIFDAFTCYSARSARQLGFPTGTEEQTKQSCCAEAGLWPKLWQWKSILGIPSILCDYLI